MFYSLRLLLFLINIDQETILNWFGLETPYLSSSSYLETNGDQLINIEIESTTAISMNTLILILKGLIQRIQDGLTLTDIENIIFFLLFLRFIIIALRYNLKTSFYITCIGLCAGYLWYRHLIDTVLMYRQMLVKVPYFQKLGASVVEFEADSQAFITTESKLNSNIHWYNPGKLLYYSFVKGIISIDPVSGKRYYIDPISMFISNLSDSNKLTVFPIYYKMYNTFIPRFFETISEFWNQLSGIIAYATITRIGKRYCPYLIRWHWTFLLIIGFVEQILIYFLYRLTYFQDVIIQGRLANTIIENNLDPSLLLQFNVLTGLLVFFITIHLGAILFGLFHAICGQYFYFPFLVENTELHIGPRPKNSIYSGGQTAWQDEKYQNTKSQFPKLWYGWFGTGSKKNNIFASLTSYLLNQIKKLRRLFSN
jgi:hypothetical protein